MTAAQGEREKEERERVKESEQGEKERNIGRKWGREFVLRISYDYHMHMHQIQIQIQGVMLYKYLSFNGKCLSLFVGIINIFIEL